MHPHEKNFLVWQAWKELASFWIDMIDMHFHFIFLNYFLYTCSQQFTALHFILFYRIFVLRMRFYFLFLYLIDPMSTFYGKKQIFDYFEPVLSLPCPSAPILVDFYIHYVLHTYIFLKMHNFFLTLKKAFWIKLNSSFWIGGVHTPFNVSLKPHCRYWVLNLLEPMW